MARSYVFLVHGVGKHPEGTWADPWKAALIGELQRYAPYDQMDAATIEKEVIAFRPVSYDAVFEGYRKRWQDLAGALVDSEVVGNRSVRKAMEWVAQHDETDATRTVFWEKVLDVLLWTFVPLARAPVIARVNKQLVEGLVAMREESGGEDNAHIVAHSLGTSVVHDSVISLQAAGGLHGGSLDASRFKWDSIFMVANTSRLLEPWVDLSDDVDVDAFRVYKSRIRPGERSSVCRSYFNARHVIDPITWPRRFDPKDWPDDAYTNVELVRYDRLEDVHDLVDYVADPAVHLRLFRRVLGNKRLGRSEEVSRAIDAYERDYPLQGATEFDELRRLLGADFEKKLGAKELVEYLTSLYREIHE